MQAAIIAGGLGTRLGALTKDIPKPLVPVAGRPFLDHQLRLLKAGGVDKVVLCIGHMGEQIQAFVGRRLPLGLGSGLQPGRPHPLGHRAAASRKPPRFWKIASCSPGGDSYLEIEHRKVWAAFLAMGLPAMMVVWRNQGAKEPSNVRLEGERVGDYDKWSPGPEFDCNRLRPQRPEQRGAHGPYPRGSPFPSRRCSATWPGWASWGPMWWSRPSWRSARPPVWPSWRPISGHGKENNHERARGDHHPGRRPHRPEPGPNTWRAKPWCWRPTSAPAACAAAL